MVKYLLMAGYVAEPVHVNTYGDIVHFPSFLSS
jgi:hypothetical protein